MINVTGAIERQRVLATSLRLQDRLEQEVRPKLASMLSMQLRDAGRAYLRTGTISGVDDAVDQYGERLFAILERQWVLASDTFAEWFEDSLKEKSISPSEFKQATQFEEAQLYWIENVGAEEVVKIQASTRTALKEVISEGMLAGEGQGAIANRISGMVEQAGRMNPFQRARTIARTETHNAANMGQLSMAEIQPIPFTKEWLAAEDKRTRPSHGNDWPLGADGQVVNLDDPFIVGGAQMQHPGDPAGPAKEVVNCRCTMLFNTK